MEKNTELTDDEKFQRLLNTRRYTDPSIRDEDYQKEKCAKCGEIFGVIGFCAECPYCKTIEWKIR